MNSTIRKVLVLTAITFSFSVHAQAQEVQFRRGLGYLVVGPTVLSGGSDSEVPWQGAGGGEFRLANGLGFGAEIGVIDNLAQVSVNPYFHFNKMDPRGKLVPFVTAGFTGAGNAEFGERWFNFGGGVDYWIKERIGVRFEIRDMVDNHHSEPWHIVGFRMGLAWR